jgi:hypothetical protein
MQAQTVGALVIATVAGAWLVRRFWRRGFDDDAHSCSSCPVDAPAKPKETSLARGPTPPARPGKVPSDSDGIRGP